MLNKGGSYKRLYCIIVCEMFKIGKFIEKKLRSDYYELGELKSGNRLLWVGVFLRRISVLKLNIKYV